MSTIRKKHEPAFKAKVAIEAAKQTKTIPEIASEFSIHPTQVKNWKDILETHAKELYTNTKRKKDTEKDEKIQELYKQVGKLTLQAEWLKKKLGIEDE